MDGASSRQFKAKAPFVGRRDWGGIAQLKLELCFSAAEPPPTDAEVNAEVEDGHRDEGWKKLQRGGAQKEVPGVVELGKALVLWNTASAHRQVPE